MATKMIQKATSRGQITLPVAWRKKFNTNHLEEYEVVFDAERDTDGKGILGSDLIKAIQENG